MTDRIRANLVLRRVLLAVTVLCFANFFSLFIVSEVIGGDALNGKVVDGQHFLFHRGGYHEVSPEIYRYSYAHVVSIFFTHPIAIACMYFADRLDPKVARRRKRSR